jgi:hypothetical protein
MQQFNLNKSTQIEPHVLGAVILGAWGAVSIVASVFLSWELLGKFFPYQILEFFGAVFMGPGYGGNFLQSPIVFNVRPLHVFTILLVVSAGVTFITRSKATALVTAGVGVLHILFILAGESSYWLGGYPPVYGLLRWVVLLVGIGLSVSVYAQDLDSLKRFPGDFVEAINQISKKVPTVNNPTSGPTNVAPPSDFSNNQQGGPQNMSNFQNPGGQWAGSSFGPDFHTPMYFVQSYATGNQLVSVAQMQQMARGGTIQASTMVQHRDSTFPVPASSIPGVFSSKTFMTALLLSIFLGGLGIDRFYLGYTGLGIVKLLTLGGCGIWSLIDLVLIAMRNLPDSDGNPLS